MYIYIIFFTLFLSHNKIVQSWKNNNFATEIEITFPNQICEKKNIFISDIYVRKKKNENNLENIFFTFYYIMIHYSEYQLFYIYYSVIDFFK